MSGNAVALPKEIQSVFLFLASLPNFELGRFCISN